MAAKRTITVDDLFKTPFMSRTSEETTRIISEGKPKPPIKMLAVIVKQEQGVVTQDFNISMYDEISWLTGCDKRNKLYCWPCLLFSDKRKPGIWDYFGVKDVMYLIERKPEHENSVSHMEAVLKLHMLIDEKKKNSKNDTLEDRQGEGKNQEIVKRLIDVCCVAIGQQPPNRCSNTGNLLDVEKCIKIMQLLQKYDSNNKYITDVAIDLIKSSPEIISRVVYVLTKVAKNTISKDMQSSKYVSLILSQHSDGRSKPQISTVLRYLKNGKVYERFVGFTNMSSSLTPDSVLQHISKVIIQFDIIGKLSAISLDGAVLQVEVLQETFLNRIKEEFPNCCFVPWYSHGVDYILQQCLSSLSTCGQFLKTMASMQAFFQKNSDVFLDLMHKCNLTLILGDSHTSSFPSCTAEKFASSQFINVVRMHRQSFVKFFDSVISNCQKSDADSLAKAFGFQKYLQRLQTVFLLKIFSRIFYITSEFSSSLKNDTYNFEKNTIRQLITNFNTMHYGEVFNELWSSMKTEMAEHSSHVKMYDNKINQYMSLFNTIIRLVTREIYYRFSVLDKLKFCNMFNFDSNGELKLQLNSWCHSLKTTQRQEFSEKLIISELVALHKHDASLTKSVYDFYKFVNESNLSNFQNTFDVLTDIAELILVMPFKPASSVGDMSKLQMIEKWSGDIACVDPCGDVSLLCIESDIFESIKKSSSLHNVYISNDLKNSFSF